MRATAAHPPRQKAGADPPGDAGTPAGDVYDDGYLRIEHRHYHVACGGQRLALSRKEFRVLSRIARGAGRWVSKVDLWASVWGAGVPFDNNNLRVSVHYVRRKLRQFGVSIENHQGMGYRLPPRGLPPDSRRED